MEDLFWQFVAFTGKAVVISSIVALVLAFWGGVFYAIYYLGMAWVS